ncbi:MAG: SMI1/KNR4 family protein [Alphaproteobacteria bacterium]|nr:SMI1/KNR4 family protein [Alphaproteobacteria bacterium]
MGDGKMRNLNPSNIIRDEGCVSIEAVHGLEKAHNLVLPKEYANFITMHNGARMFARIFNYFDSNIDKKNSNAIYFDKVEKIQDSIALLKSDEEPDWPIEYRFEDGLIPFGDNGGGDMICFDYRNDKMTDDPPIVIWNHDMGLKHRVVFIANNFEEFINMLHEPED